MSESIYDKEVAPLLKKAALVCEKNGLSLACLVEFEHEETGLTLTLTGNQGAAMYATAAAATSKGNADTLIGKLLKKARKDGHSSFYIKALGVPETCPPPSQVPNSPNLVGELASAGLPVSEWDGCD